MKFRDYITEQNKKVSTAVLMTNGEKMLIIHPTGSPPNYWEIPKGTIDKGENPKETAVREFYEETAIKIKQNNLEYVGKFPLHARKDVMMFVYKTDKLPSTSSMKCLSVFHPLKHIGDYETTAPETDGWKYIDINEYKAIVRYEMHDMIDISLEKILRKTKSKGKFPFFR